MKIEHWNKEIQGELSDIALIAHLEELGYQCTRYTYASGTVFPDHSHEVDKIDAVLSGRFRLTMNGESIVLEPGDYLYVPKNTIHSAAVVGNETVVSIDAIRRK